MISNNDLSSSLKRSAIDKEAFDWHLDGKLKQRKPKRNDCQYSSRSKLLSNYGISGTQRLHCMKTEWFNYPILSQKKNFGFRTWSKNSCRWLWRKWGLGIRKRQKLIAFSVLSSYLNSMAGNKMIELGIEKLPLLKRFRLILRRKKFLLLKRQTSWTIVIKWKQQK